MNQPLLPLVSTG